MSSFTAQADAIRSAIASVSTCTPTISASLKELLQERSENGEESTLKPSRKPAPPPARTKSSSKTTAKSAAKKSAKNTGDISNSPDGMTPKEKAVLATQVVNATLKALGDAAKTQPASNPASSPAKSRSAARTRPRRSASVPMTPLQPRSLNRVETSPIATKACPAPPTAPSTGCLALAECARVAFATLRTLQTAGTITLPDFQIESGMSSLIAKLITLRLFDQAVKELRILKRRLELKATENEKKSSSSSSNAPAKSTGPTPKTLSDLLDYPTAPYSGPLLEFVITSQLQALRILYQLNKATSLDAILPFLRPSNPTSPLNLLLSRVKGEKPDPVKIGRQLESLSQTLLSLTPSLASKDDKVAQEPRLSPSPEASLEAQAMGLITRLESWIVSGHNGDVDKDILLPLSGCLAAFLRRSSPAQSSRLATTFGQVWGKMEILGLQVQGASEKSLATIYQLLARGFQESGNSKEAREWASKWKGLTNSDDDSAAKCCAVTAQLLALTLKDSPGDDENESLTTQVLDGMQGPLSGSVGELDDLLINLCLLRKVAISIVINQSSGTTKPSPKCRELLEKFIAQLPRFALRWLGKPPASNSSTKDLLRFEQRRQLLSKYQAQMLDSALLLTKTHLDEERSIWEVMDPMLQDSLVLLEYMGSPGSHLESNPSASYHVKISHLYYQQHLALYKPDTKNIDVTSLRALKRSIESVKQQSESEQTRAKLLSKWETFVELCKASNRKDDAVDALRSIRDHLVRCETVQAITTSLGSLSLRHSWATSPESELLSRTICNLAKLERRPNDWTWLLTGDDKATAAEHDLNFILINNNQSQQGLDMSDPIIVNFLQLLPTGQHPVRRLRSLLILLATTIDSPDQVEKLREEIQAALARIQDGLLGDDTNLAHYVPHLRQYATCVFGIASGELRSSEIQTAISAWKSTVASCEDVSQLDEHIDDPQQLLQTLLALADLARMKGLHNLLTEIVELTASISQLIIDNNTESYIVHSTALCLHYLTLGQSTRAEKILQAIMERATLPQVSSDVVSHSHLSAAEYYITIGKFDDAERHLEEAREAVVASKDRVRRGNNRFSRKLSVSYASFLTSSLYLERGENYRALKVAKTAVKTLFHDWQELEQRRNSILEIAEGDTSQADSSMEDSSLSGSRMSDYETTRANTSPEFWALVYPLYRFTCQLSSIYEHLGMYQETLYYAEQAQKIAKSMGAPGYIAQTTIYLASISLGAEDTAKSLELVAEAKPGLLASDPCYQTVTALCKAASIYERAKETDDEAEVLGVAESMLQALVAKASTGERLAGGDLEAELTKAPAQETRLPKSKIRPPSAAKTVAPSRKPASKKSALKETSAIVKAVAEAVAKDEDAQLQSLKGSVLFSQSLALIRNQDWETAVATLRSASQLSTLSSDLSQALFFLGISLMNQSLSQMDNDSVFSLIQDSTLSFPSVATNTSDKSAPRQALTKQSSPVRKPRSTPQNTKVFVQNLVDAQEYLLEAHSIAARNGDNSLVHRVAAALQNVAVLLSNTSPSNACANHPAYATCSIELARNLTWRRERKANRFDAAKDTKEAWPMIFESSDPRRESLGFFIDMNRFQREYVDIIPKSWDVVSLSLDENKNDLCITKLQAGFSPFALRLPLNRACSRDADNEVFDFKEGHAELLELIQAANRSCHNAPDMFRKGAKSEWWAEREEIDERLKQLLDTIELTWLGGFKGIFTQHHKRSNLLARFQKTFQIILEKYLPSRRRVPRGKQSKKAAPHVNLDPRILELFIGLGDATIPGCDLDEPLTDLLYFVVDVLQFHGETNPYDEIDFDAMVVDTFDALHAYHTTAKESKQDGHKTHTILILDKSLHAFPWESLPCLQGLPVSRVLSLDHLRRSIMEAKASPVHEAPTESDSDEHSESTTPAAPNAGHYVSINSGTYILNPGADLKNTQATFGQALSSLPSSWGKIETRAPTELEFQTALTEKDVLLYFGHGSGAQYIRGRTIRQLEKCRAVALLMGCSSASLTHVGQFEPYGPVRGYMLAGSPAVVGTLWDVTDRDIDRFAGAVFEEWGLFPQGTFADDSVSGKSAPRKGKGKAGAEMKKKKTSAEEEKQKSLVEAVAKARTEACRFKYLTAAAVCVYGIPVYISK
ncbi:peptidase family C50-domain-containing protein [Xylaria sp. CBS 124048]|nr:peptidase family C50-domain-containing protein [Xylaria sp. CBS 124048]